MAIKPEIEQAYDRSPFDYIFNCFKDINLCDKWVNWIIECIAKVSFSVLVNSMPDEKIKPQRGK